MSDHPVESDGEATYGVRPPTTDGRRQPPPSAPATAPGSREQIRVRRLDPAAIKGVMSREVANFRTFWKGTTFSSVLEPIIYLLSFGLGLGSTIVGEVEGVPYAQFVGTGMVATAVIFSSALPAMFGTFVKHHFQNTYDAILAAPVDVEELVTAEMLWIGLRSGVYGTVPLLVTIGFGLDPAPGMLLVPLFAFITACAFAAFGITVAAMAEKIDQFNYVTTLGVTPLFLVAGTFFPISGLPQGLRIAAQLNPLHHLVELVRHAAFGFQATDLLRVAFLVALALVLWRLAVARMRRRLID
ncbi:MAG: ABC transporter permease [Actinobacteria bacterium]|nr:ABC transporter permease [Actinomycetota bacterium]